MSGPTANNLVSNKQGASPPSPLPQYEVLGYLGGGGMGEIFKARHVHLDRTVVIKWLRSDVPVSPQMEARFKREMLAAGQVTHPNVVNATDAGIVDGRRYLVMEYIDGVDLSVLCKCVGRLPIADACEVIRQSALGLAKAHDTSIVHRDIKPTNIMVASDGSVKVLDLGLALLQRDDESDEHTLTSADSGPFGTYDYMSPEQWGDTHSVDHRSDLYSLGCTLYFLLCGHAPFGTDKHKSPTAKMRGHVLEDIPSIQDLRPDVPDELNTLLDQLLAKEVDQRSSSADELAEALSPFVAGSDLKNLIASAHVADSRTDGSSGTSNPESQTILVGSSHQDAMPPTITGKPSDGNETRLSNSQTVISTDNSTAPASRTARWLFAGTAAAALFTAGAAASIFFVLNSDDRTDPSPDLVVDGNTNPEDIDTQPERVNVSEPVVPIASEDADTDRTGDEPEMVTPVVIPEFEPLPIQELLENESATVLVSLRNIQELRGKVAFALGPGAPSGLRIDAETGVIRWQPGEEDGGTGEPVEVTVLVQSLAPGIEPVETTVMLNVAEVNQPPRLARIGDVEVVDAGINELSAVEGEPFEVDFTLDDADLPANPLELTSIGSLPAGARLTQVDDEKRTWKLTWMPDEQHGGGDDVQIRLRADDGVTPIELNAIRIAVAEVNVPPTIASVNGASFSDETPFQAQIAEGRPLEFTITAADVDLPANPLTLAAIGELPDGAELEPVEQRPRTWKLKWTPGEVYGGDEPVTIRLRASDADASSEIHSVVVTVSEVNVAPMLAAIGGTDVRDRPEYPVTAREGTNLEITLIATDADLPANPLEIQAVEPLPEGARIAEIENEPGTWKLSWTPDEATGGSGKDVRIPLRAFDGDKRSEPRTVVVRVDEVNAAPDFATIGGEELGEDRGLSITVDEEQPLSVAISGVDVDLPKNPLTLVPDEALPEGAEIVPDEDDPRLWRLMWTPTEAQGGYAPFEIPLQIKDDEASSRPASLLVRVDEVNTRPVIAEIEPQSAGPGSEFLLDIDVSDRDLPRQELSIEIEQPDGVDAQLAWVPLETGPPETLRFKWRPGLDRNQGEDLEFTVRVTDNGKPPLSASRTFQVGVGRYITNSIGMQLALLPTGQFRMGNLNPEQLEELIPKAPEIPEQPDRQPGVRNPFGDQPTRPGTPAIPPGVPRSQPGQAPEQPGDEETEEPIRPDDVPVRELPVANAFYIGAFEVTQGQFETVMGANPSYHAGAGRGGRAVADLDTTNLPVESLSYAEAIEFCRRLSELPEELERGRIYRLPSEIEWEYACRAGGETMFHTGERLSSSEANFDGRYPTRGTQPGPFLSRSTIVGSYEPNDFGLYDMHGNVAEWCFDWYAVDAYEHEFEWFGPKDGEQRVVRGGNYRSQRAYQTRSAGRDSRDPESGSSRIGFRVVCETVGARIVSPVEPEPDPQPDE